MSVRAIRIESALIRPAVVAITVLALTLMGAPHLAAQEATRGVSSDEADNDAAKKK